MSVSKEQREELKYFFEKYREFSEIEMLISLIKGREYDIIKQFYELFFLISKEKIEQEKVSKAKEDIESSLEEYKKDNQDINQQCSNTSNNRSDYLCSIAVSLNKGAKISQAFVCLVNAINQYGEWRKILSEDKEAIKEIYIKNLQDRQSYYFKNNPNGINGEELSKLLTEKQIVEKNYILRQSLIEFYNGISHLSIAYCNSETEINIERAANHFKRGALDSYKAIIKDFCLLAGKTPLKEIIDKIYSIRKCECNTIGSDEERNKQDIYFKYQNLTSLILNSRKSLG